MCGRMGSEWVGRTSRQDGARTCGAAGRPVLLAGSGSVARRGSPERSTPNGGQTAVPIAWGCGRGGGAS